MGTIQVPGRLSGRTYNVNIKGDTPSPTEQERIRNIIAERESKFVQKFQSQFGEAPTPMDDGTAIGRGFEVGKAGAYSRLGTATEYLGSGLGLESLVNMGRDMREAGDYEGFLESMRQPAPTTLEDVKAAEGILPTISAGLTYAGEGIGQSGPEMLAPLAATVAGTVAGGPLAGLAAGSATAFPSFFGGNVQRQEAEVAAGRKAEVDVSDAIISAVGQSALNAIGDKLLLGGFLKPGQKWLTRTAVGVGEGAATEIPTEITQQIIERKQAGLPLDDDEAINEYINAGILGGIMGGGIRGVTAGLGVGMKRPATPPATTPPATTTPKLGAGQEQGELFADLPTQDAPVSEELTVGSKAPSTEQQLEMFAPAAGIAGDTRTNVGVATDQDLAEARGIYDERLALAEEGGADPEEAKRIAAEAAVNYVDSLDATTKQRLSRFRNTMARMAAGPTRGVMQPSLPDEAYAPEFGPTVQEDLFAAQAAAPRPGSYEDAVANGFPPVPAAKLKAAGTSGTAATAPTASAPGMLDVGGIDEAISQGVGNISVTENGEPVPFEKFAISVDGDRAEVGFVERAKDARKGIGYDAYITLGEKLAQRGVKLQSSQTKLGPGQNLWKKLEQNGYAKLNPQTKRLEFVTQAERDATKLEVQDDTTTAAFESAAVGVGPTSGERIVGDGQPVDDAQAAERVETPEGGGLERGVSVPMGADTAAGAEPTALTQLEERLAAARARAAELRKQVPVGVLEREMVGGRIDPALVKKAKNLENVLARQQAAADSAKAKLDRTKVAGATRDGRMKAYTAALDKVRATQTQLAETQDTLSAAELAAGLQRAAVPKTPMTDKNKGPYTAYFNALKEADTIRQTLESERARGAAAEPAPAPLPTDLREPVIEDTFLTYQTGITTKPVRPVAPSRGPADVVAKERISQRLTQFFQQRATPALLRYTTAQGGINNPASWKYVPDWMRTDDQSKVVQLLGRLSRKEREKYKFPASEVEPLSPDAEAAHTYFSKTIRPVDAIDMMLDDLSADYEIYEGSLKPGRTEIEHRDLMMGTGSEVAKRALNWVRANMSPEANEQIDLILKKQADKNAVTENWIGAEGTDRVAGGRAARDAARKARKAAATESGYDAASIVRKMAAGDPRVALDQTMHYSVRAALDAGDLKGALLALADTTSNAELKALARRFAELTGTTRVRVLYPGDSARHIGRDLAVFLQQKPGVEPDYSNIILINGQTGMTNHVLMHEMAHAVTSNLVDTQPNHPVVKQLQTLLDELRSRGPSQNWYKSRDGRTARFDYPTEFYGLRDVAEMIAEAYGRVTFGESDNGLRDLMKRTTLPTDRKVEFEIPLNAWERFKELMGNLFNFVMRRPMVRRPRRKFTETVQAYESALSQFHRLVDGLLSEAPQVLPDSVMQAAVVHPMIGKNVLDNAVLSAPVWSAEGRTQLGDLLASAVPKWLRGALLGPLQLDWFNDLAGKYFPQIAQLKVIDDLRRGKIQRLNESAKPRVATVSTT